MLEIATRTNILDIPEDIFRRELCKYLSPSDLKIAGCVSKKFQENCSSDEAWKPKLDQLAHEILPGLEVDPKTSDFKCYYRRLFKGILKEAKSNYDNLYLKFQIPDSLKANRDFMLALTKVTHRALYWASPELQNDKDIVLAAVSSNKADEYILSDVSSELQNNKDIVLAAVSHNPLAYQFASTKLQDDKDVTGTAVLQRGDLLTLASDNLQHDRAFILELLQKNGLLLEHVLPEFKEDKVVVLTAIKQNQNAINYISSKLWDNKRFMRLALSQCPLFNKLFEKA